VNIEAAALRTLEIARANAEAWRADATPDMSLAHLESMWARWPHEGSPTKRCRWLGWMQATVVAMAGPAVTLEDMKRVNLDCADDPAPGPGTTKPEDRAAMVAAAREAISRGGPDAAEAAVDAVLAILAKGGTS
jgi:hypothetical protein